MIHEPTTVATDYLLAVAATVFAVRLWRAALSRGALATREWALAFAFTAVASLLGGTYHGFAPRLVSAAATALWKGTVYSVGLASLFLLLGASRHPLLRAFAVVKFTVYAVWMVRHDDFVYVIADYGLTLLIVAVIQIVRWGPSSKWYLGSVAVSVMAALVQQSRLTLHQHFNHNDLYHVIQLVALWLLYRAGMVSSRA